MESILTPLGIFRGKRVRIVPHRDAVGADAAARWRRQLEAAGAAVDEMPIDSLASGRETVKDLNYLCRLPIDWQATVAQWLVFWDRLGLRRLSGGVRERQSPWPERCRPSSIVVQISA